MMSVVMDWGLIAEQQQSGNISKYERNNISSTFNPALESAANGSQVKIVSFVQQPTVFHYQDSTGKKDKPDTSEAEPDTSEAEPDTSEAEASLMRKILRSNLVKSTYQVEVQQKNPNSPLYSVKSFEELNLPQKLLRGVYAIGYNSPSKIQETALPVLLVDPPQNMIAQSQSGTGKTAAFVLTCLNRINASLKYPQVLILSPTLELAEQTGNVAKAMAQYCPEIEFCFAVRGKMRTGPITEQFLIGTPGKVLDWALRYKCFDIKKILVFVLDEADVMISTQGHQDQSIRIHKNLNQNCQMMLFSATYTEEVVDFAQLIVPNPVVIRLRREEESLDNIKQYFIDVTKDAEECTVRNFAYNEQKYRVLQNIYGVITIGQAIIFCRTRKTASWLAQKMTIDGHAVSLLSGELSVDQRVAIITRFRKGKERVMITTNICARGIDIEQVTIVVNFDLPLDLSGRADCETYLHRIGRSGRFGKCGLAINMIDGPKSMQVLKEIEEHFRKKIPEIIAEDIDETTFT